jgi:hypothetical protein
MRYAEGTTVPVSKSRLDMQHLLDTNGCTAFGFERLEDGDALYFKLGGRSYRIVIRKPTEDEQKKANERRYKYSWNRDVAADIDAEYRRRWRANLMLLIPLNPPTGCLRQVQRRRRGRGKAAGHVSRIHLRGRVGADVEARRMLRHLDPIPESQLTHEEWVGVADQIDLRADELERLDPHDFMVPIYREQAARLRAEHSKRSNPS